MEKIKTTIKFKNKDDFRSRIARLWQDQQENEIYEFIWPDKETEQEWNDLIKSFKLSPTKELTNI